MNMKKLSVAVMVILGMGMSSAYAADGSLNFTGSVASGTCSIDSNSNTLSVDFDAVTVANIMQMKESGLTLPSLQRTISINLNGCPDSVSTAKINFEGAVSSYNPNIFIGNSTAKFVGALIKDQAGNTISANTADGEFNSQSITEGANTLNYVVGLTRTTYTANATAGTINIPLTYTLSYQ